MPKLGGWDPMVQAQPLVLVRVWRRGSSMLPEWEGA